MKRLACLIIVAILAACGSDSSRPTDTFTGTWIGAAIADSADTVTFRFMSTQTGGSVIGTGIVSEGAATNGFTFGGTLTAPTLNLMIQASGGGDPASYAGTYVTSDSIAGIITSGPVTTALDLKKQ